MATIWEELTLYSGWNFDSVLLNNYAPQVSTLGTYAILRGAASTGSFTAGAVGELPGSLYQGQSDFIPNDPRIAIFPVVYKEILSYTGFSRTWLLPLHIDLTGAVPVLYFPTFVSSDPRYNIYGTIGTLYFDGIIYSVGDLRGGDTPYLYTKDAMGFNYGFVGDEAHQPFMVTESPALIDPEHHDPNINLKVFQGRAKTTRSLDLTTIGWRNIMAYPVYQSLRGNYSQSGISMWQDTNGVWHNILLGMDEKKGQVVMPNYQFENVYNEIPVISLDGIRYIPDNSSMATTAYGSPDDAISAFWAHNYHFGARPRAPYNYSAITSANIAVHITDRAAFAPVDYVIGRLADAAGQLSPAHPMVFPAIIYDGSAGGPINNRWKTGNITVKNGNDDFGIPQTVITFSRWEHLGMNNFYMWTCPFWTMAKDPFQ